MKKKNTYTETVSFKAIDEETKNFNRQYNELKSIVKNQCRQGFKRAVELQLQHLKDTPGCMLPKKLLDREQTIDCIQIALQEYMNEIIN